MIFNKIRLKNFQSHKDTIIDLSDKVNCIVGQTHHGKSSIVRAIYFFFTNDWSNDYLRHKADNTEITLYSGNISIKRVKGKDNYFEVKKDKEKQIYDKIGRGPIPVEIQKILQINSDMFFNIARQNPLDLDFLMTDTSSQRSSQLSVILKLDKIENAINDIRTDINKAKREFNQSEDILKKLEEEYNKFRWIEELDKKIISHKNIVKQLKDNIEKINKYEDYKSRSEKISIYIKKIKNQLILFPDVNKERLKNIEINIQKIMRLRKYNDKYEKINNYINSLNNQLKCISQIDKNKIIEVEENIRKLLNYKKLLEKFDNIKNQITNLKDKITYVSESKKEQKKLFQNFISELDKCPICLSDISPSMREKIFNNLTNK